ncbi:coiled-coil domain-containing protein 6 [Bacillus rossius redtenbacheri]|uniref:coiled-coil domain-containing protein 6 n=1 Tax=Bacillus rossius redtenbacheri TaxID=93214 RepID=UPI002FDF07F5
MADSASESDSSSIDGGPIMMPPSPVTREQLQKRIESLQQQNRVLKVELETYKLRVKALQEENKNLRKASVIIQAKAEQEEEYISNTLLKKIQSLKKEKETLVHHYEQEEECLTNDLTRKLNQLRQEKCCLEQTLEQEQECLVNKLMRKIEKLEAETSAKQANLEQLRREKVELENTLEQEQEALVNRLWKDMEKLEEEKRVLQIKLDEPVSGPASPKDLSSEGDTASHLSSNVQSLRKSVEGLRRQLATAQKECSERMMHYAKEEKVIREENLRLQRKLQLEVERRKALCRHLSESESSLEMEDERAYNELATLGGGKLSRTVSSPVPYPSPSSSRPLSPGASMMATSGRVCPTCGQAGLAPAPLGTCSPPAPPLPPVFSLRRASDRFVKPLNPLALGLAPAAPAPACEMPVDHPSAP